MPDPSQSALSTATAPDVRLVAIDTVYPDPENIRQHDALNLAAISDSLTAFGQQKPLVVARDGRIIAGNGTYAAALALGWATIAVQYSDLSPAKARAYAVADNRTAELAHWDEAGLRATLQYFAEQELPMPGWTPEELAALCDTPMPGTDGAAPSGPNVGALAARWLVPPFSVLDARQGYWQNRKRYWLGFGIQSEIGRGETLLGDGAHSVYTGASEWAGSRGPAQVSPGGSPRPAAKVGANGKTRRGDGAGKPLAESYTCGGPRELRDRYSQGETSSLQGGLTWRTTMHPHDGGESIQTGTSIFDPVLCELAYRWFCPPAGSVLDPFCGGSVRGVVAASLGHAYTGVDLRPEQVDANEAQWATISGRAPAPWRPVPRVEAWDGLSVVRDDETPGGTKVRALLAWLPHIPETELCYASPAAGFAQWALALAAQATGKRCTIFTAARKDLHPASKAAEAAGAVLHQVPRGYLSHVQAKARAYCEATGALYLPFGLDDPGFVDALADVVQATAPEPAHVWCVAGSGVLARAIRQAWPTAALHCVVIGKEPALPTENVTVYRAPEKFEDDAEAPPPFPSCGNYDAKAWRFLQAHAEPGSLFWNVGGLPGVAAPASGPAPHWLVGDSRELGALLPPETAYDLLFTCPPYADLECYSHDPRDLSTMAYPDFLASYRAILAASLARLRDDRFAVVVIGDVRDPHGHYRNLVSETILAALAVPGVKLYNEAILVTVAGSLPLRAGKVFTASRKLGKTHQNVLVFVKGDWRAATEACGPVEVDDALAAIVETEAYEAEEGDHGPPY